MEESEVERLYPEFEQYMKSEQRFMAVGVSSTTLRYWERFKAAKHPEITEGPSGPSHKIDWKWKSSKPAQEG